MGGVRKQCALVSLTLFAFLFFQTDKKLKKSIIHPALIRIYLGALTVCIGGIFERLVVCCLWKRKKQVDN